MHSGIALYGPAVLHAHNLYAAHPQHAHRTGNMNTGATMSAIETNRSFADARVGGFVAKLVSSIRAEFDSRKTRRELSRLSDRELDDIGLCRGDINEIARRF